ncbi:MAG: hypothetical protein ACE5PV_17545 [Candidatus Poribacteria bacterium]
MLRIIIQRDTQTPDEREVCSFNGFVSRACVPERLCVNEGLRTKANGISEHYPSEGIANILILFLWNVAFLLLAHVAFMRYDVR